MSLSHSGHVRAVLGPAKTMRRTVTPQQGAALPASVEDLGEFLGDACPPSGGTVAHNQWQLYLRAAADTIIRYTDREMLARPIVITFDVGDSDLRRQAFTLVRLIERASGWLTLPRVPASGAVTVDLSLSGGTVSALDADQFEVDTMSEPHRLWIDADAVAAAASLFNTLHVSYDAGYAESDLPGPLKLSVLQLAAYYYEHRGAVGADPVTQSGVRSIIAPYRVKIGL